MTARSESGTAENLSEAERLRSRSGFILTVNGGSSSIKFSVYEHEDPPRCLLRGSVDRIGQSGTVLQAARPGDASREYPFQDASDHNEAADRLIEWLGHRLDTSQVVGVGHRVVHGGVHLIEHQKVTDELVAELRRMQPLDVAHLPREIALIESFRRHFTQVPQVACFDTMFHRDLPRVARILPIPRRYEADGVRRFGFHGLSYAYLTGELERVAGAEAVRGRVILAHLGSGSSMAALRGGSPIDTTMAFTPTAGLVMGTRPGDLDPGLLVYLMRKENRPPEEMDQFISRQCGLLGVSETSADMRDLLSRRTDDVRAAEAVDLFCYQARKWIGAFAAALGGLDTLVFAGGIGEHSPEVRAEICDNLGFLGLQIDPDRNQSGSAVISAQDAPVTVRVMHTDEEIMIAASVTRVLGLGPQT